MNRIVILIYRFVRFTARRPRITLSVALVLFFVALVGASKLKTLTRLDDMLDQDFVSTRENARLKALFESSNQFMIAVEKKKGKLQQEDLCYLEKFSSRLTEQFPEIMRIQSPFELRQAAYQIKENTLWFPRVLENICTSSFRINQYESFIGRTPWKGTLTAKNEAYQDFLFELNFKDDLDFQIIPRLKTWVERELQSSPEQALVPHFSGEADFQYFTNVGYEWIERLNLLICLVLLGTCFLFFRTLKSGFILIVTLIITSIFLKGLMGFTQVPVDILSSNFISHAHGLLHRRLYFTFKRAHERSLVASVF